MNYEGNADDSEGQPPSNGFGSWLRSLYAGSGRRAVVVIAVLALVRGLAGAGASDDLGLSFDNRCELAGTRLSTISSVTEQDDESVRLQVQARARLRDGASDNNGDIDDNSGTDEDGWWLSRSWVVEMQPLATSTLSGEVIELDDLNSADTDQYECGLVVLCAERASSSRGPSCPITE